MQPCPRQRHEATLDAQRNHLSHWRDDATCSYCGSLMPAKLFEAIEKGAPIAATDKNYKLYVEIDNPKAGEPRVVSSCNFAIDPARLEAEGWQVVTDALRQQFDLLPSHRFVQIRPDEAKVTAKVYFQHFTEAERHRFLDLMNAGRLTFRVGVGFYVLPFFVHRREPN